MAKLSFARIPYFDNFKAEKNFAQVLFKPKKSIQVRELNQIQSVFNDQMERFADHIFKFGSRVDAGSVRLEKDIEYVKLKALDVNGAATDVSQFEGKTVKGLFSQVVGIVKATTAADSIDPDTLFVNYTEAGEFGTKIRFAEGEPLVVQDSTAYTVELADAAATGFGTVFTVSESTYYAYGTFVNCAQQSIVLDKYGTTPSIKVGLLINQSLVTSYDDKSLLDNAIGSDNYSAPGADRYKIDLVLIRKPLDSENDEQFIQLAKIEEGVVVDVINRPQYADIGDMLARRTYDESGNYTVTPFLMEIDSDLMARMSEGKAYVYGYEIEKGAQSFLQLDKADNVVSLKDSTIQVDYGNKMYTISYDGGPDFNPYLLSFTEFDIQPYGQGDSSGTMFIKSWEFIYTDGNNDDFYLMNFFDTNFTFNYTNDDPLNTLYDVDRDNTMLIPLPQPYVTAINGDIDIVDNTEAAVTLTYKTKTVTEGTMALTITSPTGQNQLNQADGIALVSVMQGAVDVTDRFDLISNAGDNYYEYSAIQLKAGATVVSGTVDVVFTYYEHGNLTGDAFSVESYSHAFDEFPTHTSKNGTVYNLRDVLDFRPIKTPGDTWIGLNAYPKQGSTITVADISVYEGRRDLIVINNEGLFQQVKGTAEKYPAVPDGGMPIYRLDMAPNTTDPIADIQQVYVENKRYTMRDIGELETKINNLEEYVTLNLLEQDLETMTVTDAAGNNRYKNGFLTDNFSDLQAAATYSGDYQAGVDAEKQELRPSFKKRDLKLQVNASKSSHYQITGDIMTLPYSDVSWHVQPYASKTISVNPYFVFAAEGTVLLSPANDVWTDTVTAPAIKASIDTGVAAVRQIASAAGIQGTFWGTPRTTEEILASSTRQRTSTSSRARSEREFGGGGIQTTTSIRTAVTTTTTRTDTVRATTTRDGVKKGIEAKITDHSLGSKVKDIELLTYIRQTDVQFFATGLKANLKHYFFFDDVDVSDVVRPINGAFGDDMESDAFGNISGVFRIPNTAKRRFFVGTKIFRITNSSTNSTDPDELLSYSEAQYHAGGLKQIKQDTVLSVAAPAWVETDVQATSTRTFNRNTSRSSTAISDRVTGVSVASVAIGVDPPPPRRGNLFRMRDPIAQSFFVQEAEGVFLTKLDTYFSEVGDEHDIWLEVREMVNGYPGPRVLPFGKLSKKPSAISVSDDASVATTWTFESPIYLAGNAEYCFVIGSDTADHRVFISKLGAEDIATGKVISDQPHMGSMFKGQNNKTWNASQYEDIMFTLYKAEFDISADMVGAFNRDDTNTKEEMPVNPLETTADSELVRIHHNSHGLSLGDKVKLDMLGDNEFTILVSSGNIAEGQTISCATGSFVIKKLTAAGTDAVTGNAQYTIMIDGLNGYFPDNSEVTGGAYIEPVSAKAAVLDITFDQTNTALTGTIPTGIDNTFNGIGISELSTKSHTVIGVDSLDTFTIKLNVKADTTGRIGGSGNYLMPNIVMEGMELNVADMDFAGTGNWYFDSVRHAGVGSTLQNDLAVTGVMFNANEFTDLDLPVKMNTTLVDANKYQSGRRSFIAYGTYESASADLSPVINIASIGMGAYGNRIEYNDTNTMVDWVDETSAIAAGTEKAKYVTNIIKLDDPAEDIKVWMDVLNNIESEVQLWYRTLDEQSYDSLLEQDWVQVTGLEWPESENEFIEAEFDLTPVPGTSIDPFKEFQVKIVMKTKNSAKVPKIKRFRCLALT